MRRHGLFSIHNPWKFWGAVLVASMLVMGIAIGFLWLPQVQERPVFGDRLKKPGGWFASFCRGLGWTGDAQATATAAPPARWASDMQWTPDTVHLALSGDRARGEFVALNCTACHGEKGQGGQQTWIPKLARMDRLVIYKQLADYRSGHRQWGVMNAVAMALSEQDSADVAAYFNSQAQPPLQLGQEGSNPPLTDARFKDAQKLVYNGDPLRHVAACATCHGPSARMTAAPDLQGQHPAYLTRQLGDFAQGHRANDLHLQMRAIASQLSPDEMNALGLFLAQGKGPRDAR